MRKRSKPFLAIIAFTSILFPSILLSTTSRPSMDVEVKLSPKSAAVDVKVYSFDIGAVTCFEHDKDSVYAITVVDHLKKEMEITRKEEGRFCVLPPKPDFGIRYRVRLSSYKGPVSEESGLYNLALGKAVLLFGDRVFLRPVPPDDDRPSVPARVKFVTSSLRYFINSISLEKKEINVRDVQKLSSCVILAGEMRDDDAKIEGKRYHFSFVGDWEKGTRRKIYRAYRDIAREQFKLWGFMPKGDMLVSFIRSRNAGAGAGFQYNNAIVYILPLKVNTADVEFLKLLAHEHFHMWNGYYLRPAAVQNTDIKWFHEGVTSYYSLMTLLPAGLVTEKALLENIARNYVKYDSSQEKPSEASLRGFFTAMAMDLEIMRASKLKFNLDKVLKGLSSRTSVVRSGYTNDDVIVELTKTGNWEISDFFGQYIYAKRKIAMDQYFGYLGLRYSSDLHLVKDAERASYEKWMDRGR